MYPIIAKELKPHTYRKHLRCIPCGLGPGGWFVIVILRLNVHPIDSSTQVVNKPFGVRDSYLIAVGC